MKRAATLLLLLATTLGFAQNIKTFTITPPGEGGFSYVMQKPGEVKDLVAIEGKSAEVAAPDDPNGYTLYIVDSAINRAAKADLVQILKTKKFAPKSDAFTAVAQIVFRIETKDGDLPAGNLTLIAGDKTESLLITANDKNQAVVRFWPSEKLGYKLDYDVKGEKKNVSGSFEIPKSSGPFTQTIAVEESFAPEAPAESGKSGTAVKAEKPKGDTGQNPIFAFLRLLVGLAVVGGLGYGAWWYYKNNQQVVEKLADQAGLTAQANANNDPTGALPPEQVKKELQKIDLGASAEPMATSVTTSSPAVKNPRLVTFSGDVHIVQEGTATVGRENADLTLAGETSVSRHHADISRSGTQITVSDAGSTNGTYINGTKIAAPTVLQPGDTVQFGAVSYRYEE